VKRCDFGKQRGSRQSRSDGCRMYGVSEPGNCNVGKYL
jgi:hypothetical protein